MFSIREELAASAPDWANIIDDILRYIADMTHSVLARIHMAAVCRSWNAFLMDQKINFPACLMLAEKENSDKRCFYNLSEEIFVELDLPEIRGRRCWGTPFGWLATCGLDLEIQLFNPLSRASLPLPSLRTFTPQEDGSPEHLCKFFLTKLILSSNPEESGSDCIVLAIYSQYCLLAFAKPGDQAWTPIDNNNKIRPVMDTMYFKGNFYASKNTGEIFLCENFYGAHPKAVEFAPSPPSADDADQKYLFDLDGNLCVACRGIVPSDDNENGEDVIISSEDRVGETYVTVEFGIFKLDMHTRSWEKIFSLGDRSLFLGNCCTFAIGAADYHGCKPNCIYFTDDEPDFYVETGGSDMGIYDCQNLKLDIYNEEEDIDFDALVEPFPNSVDVQHLLHSSLSPPLWIIPFSRKQR